MECVVVEGVILLLGGYKYSLLLVLHHHHYHHLWIGIYVYVYVYVVRLDHEFASMLQC